MWIGRLYTEYVGFEYGLTEQKRICLVFFCKLVSVSANTHFFTNVSKYVMLYYKRQNGIDVRSSGCDKKMLSKSGL